MLFPYLGPEAALLALGGAAATWVSVPSASWALASKRPSFDVKTRFAVFKASAEPCRAAGGRLGPEAALLALSGLKVAQMSHQLEPHRLVFHPDTNLLTTTCSSSTQH